jgi:hypothetical protein
VVFAAVVLAAALTGRFAAVRVVFAAVFLAAALTGRLAAVFLADVAVRFADVFVLAAAVFFFAAVFFSDTFAAGFAALARFFGEVIGFFFAGVPTQGGVAPLTLA